MTQQLDPKTLLTYIQKDQYEGGLPANDFGQAFHLFLALLDKLEYAANEEALSNLPLNLDDQQRRWLNRLTEAANRIDEAGMAQTIGEELYHAQKEPRTGESNPELLNLPFWHYMIQRRLTAWQGRMTFDPACQVYMQHLMERPEAGEDEKVNEEAEALWEADAPKYIQGNAVWSFVRFGQTCTKMADGRQIYIGGEHEDWYDYDFHIYNDVIVIDRNMAIDIYCYPLTAFKPTDFHTATLVGDSIYIIGRLGYHGLRQPGETPVYRLDCNTFHIESIAIRGDNPGWIHNHHAEYLPARNAIKVTQGEIFLRFEGKRHARKNRATYYLDLATGEWTRGKGKSMAQSAPAAEFPH